MKINDVHDKNVIEGDRWVGIAISAGKKDDAADADDADDPL